ncbi:SitI3 family protein [Streptomyces sp. NPDC001480]|uniref:SitI3 family protein n=1 Tax=Streptomyces sp. NPDC001480 TaxID=3364577 RepID=UPI0036A7C243
MAIDYDLDCATRSTVDEVAGRLLAIGRGVGVFDGSVTRDGLMEGTGTRLDTWVRVLRHGPCHPWHPVVAGLGFTPTVTVAFRMAKGVEVSEQQDDMLRLVMPLLAQVDGDAVMHFQFEEVWLLRRNGQLTLNEQDVLWRPQRLALVPGPYRRQTHIMDD